MPGFAVYYLNVAKQLDFNVMSLNVGLNYLMQKVRVTQDFSETIHQIAQYAVDF